MESPERNVPRVIYSLWLQGRERAPDLVKLNFERWEKLNPDYEIVVLDLADVQKLLQPWQLAFQGLSPQALSDVVRVRLMLNNGGIWADASVFPIKPLSEWLSNGLVKAGFFAYERPGQDRPISSWFLVSTQANAVVRALWREIERFWSKPRMIVSGIPDDPAASVSPEVADGCETYPYFWLHYLFQYLLETDRDVAQIWAKCPKISADGPHSLQQEFSKNIAASILEIRKAAQNAPLQKLNWRISYPLDSLVSLS